jgi:16S rRNA C967 or C1407 C5-methylase (RsmB/RsmF family)
LGDRINNFLKVSSYDAQQWGLHEKNAYDKILLDAPCSSERHVLMDEKELKNWSIKRPERLAIEQFSMLCSALEAVKPKGLIVYSTCSLHPLENDGIIKKLYEKRTDLFTLIRKEFPFGEPTEFGWRVLPDTHEWGPFYLSIIQKR